jgi:hypothetical protein
MGSGAMGGLVAIAGEHCEGGVGLSTVAFVGWVKWSDTLDCRS